MSLGTSQQAEEGLSEQTPHEREKAYRQIIAALDQSSDMIVLFDPDDRIVFSNQAWKRLNSDVAWTTRPGVTYEQHIRALTENGLVPDAIGREEEWIAERLERHRNPRGPFELATRNDQWISINEQVLEDGATILVIRDVTGIKKAEHLIRTQNERFNVALQNMPAGLCVYDKSHRLVVCNDRFGEMYGVAPESLHPGMAMTEVMAQRIAKGIYAGDSPEDYLQDRFEWAARHKAGSKTETLNDGRTMQITQQPLADGGWLSIHEDVSERINAHKALVESERQFRNLTEGSIQGFYIARDWKLLFVNQALADIFGYESPEDLLAVGSPLRLMAPCERDRVKAFNAARKRGEYAPETYEIRGVRKDGSQLIAEFRIKLVQWQGDTATQCVVLDITDRKRAEAELLRHRDQLQELVDGATRELKIKAEKLNQALAKEKALNEQQKHFLAVASHEFRTPLSIIDSSVQRLLRRKDDMSPEYIESRARKIRAAIKTMTNLMESTLSAARIDAGKFQLKIHDCDLRSIVLEACARQAELDGTHGITCDLDGLPARIRADGTALEHIFTNLLSNTVKYSPDGPEISVRGWTEGEDILVSVQDRGIGIDESEIPKLFSRFFRASTSSGIPGTGIGLNFIMNLVALHGGSIDVESTRGEGSTFTVRLPAADPGPVELCDPDTDVAGFADRFQDDLIEYRRAPAD